jgi:hypothetical protein
MVQSKAVREQEGRCREQGTLLSRDLDMDVENFATMMMWRQNIILLYMRNISIRYGVVANIIASHAIARGSIPRVGMFLTPPLDTRLYGFTQRALSLLVFFASVPDCECEQLAMGEEADGRLLSARSRRPYRPMTATLFSMKPPTHFASHPICPSIRGTP